MKKQLWSYGGLLRVSFANKPELKDQVAKSYTQGRFEACRSTKVTWNECPGILMAALKREKEEIISSHKGRTFTKIAWGGKPTTIKYSRGAKMIFICYVPSALQ